MSRVRKGPTVPGFRYYQDKRGEWRWRLVSENGQIVATPGEGFTTRHGAQRNAEAVKRLATEATP